jgi:hypothetical protein
MSFVNFILITYSFAVQKNPLFHGVITSLSFFTIVFLAVYVPTAMAIGYWHRRNQFRVEVEATLQEAWVSAWLLRYQFRLALGKATEEETREVVNFYESVLRRHNKPVPPQNDGPKSEPPLK